MLSRRFRNVPTEMQRHLAEEFSELSYVLMAGEGGAFKHLAVSVFDHWLSAEEARRLLSSPSKEVQLERDSRLHLFACDLAAGSEPLLVKWVGRKKVQPNFRRFLGASARAERLKPAPYNVGGRSRFTLVFPELAAIYVEGDDFTHHLYLREPQRAGPVYAAAEKAGLFVLE